MNNRKVYQQSVKKFSFVFAPPNNSITSLIDDNRGIVLSVELILTAIVALVGLIVTFSAVRDSFTSEVSDVAGAVQDINQSYSYNGIVGHSATNTGSAFVDATDHCDDVDDIAGQADNCITFDVPPTDELLGEVNDAGLVTQFLFDTNGSDTSPNGNSNNGILQGGASIVNGQLVLDGINDRVRIPNSPDINLGTHTERTIALQFTANEVISRQILFEEGGTVRGLNIYIDNGMLFVGGWNIPETGWAPTFISTPIVAGQEISVALVLDGTNTVQPGALTGYVNGAQFGSAVGSQINGHSGGIGLGGINGRTNFHDGASTGGNGFNFGGTIDNFSLYNRALDAGEVGILANQ